MQKPEKISWRDTNLALIGSELDHKVKAAAAEGEEAWTGPPKIGSRPGLLVWRIEKFLVKSIPTEQYGKFFRGDSYIVLHSYGADRDNLHHDLHIWIGSESSQDEYGTAAYKMVEADDFLGGSAVQHRQVEGNEDSEFVALFESLQYLEGGIESGFTKVEPTKEQPLFFKFFVRKDAKTKKKKGELMQVPMTTDAMDSSGAFILYADKSSVWAWHGEDCPPLHKIAATHQGDKLCTLGTVTVLAQGDGDDEETEFWDYLKAGTDTTTTDCGEKSRSIGKPRSMNGVDGGVAYESKAAKISRLVQNFKPKLFLVEHDPTKQLEPCGLPKLLQRIAATKMGDNPLSRSLASGGEDGDSQVFLFDVGSRIFVWTGKKANSSDKVAALGAADRYAVIEPRANDVPVTVLKAGQERFGLLSYLK